MDSQSTLIMSIALALIVVIALHSWVHQLITFKMDESAILKCLQDLKQPVSYEKSIQIIVAKTDINEERVTAVCQKSQTITAFLETQTSQITEP